MQFVDKALARRLESGEELPQVQIAQLLQKSRPEVGAAFEEICGGHMIFAGVGSPIGRAVGLGFDQPLTDADLDRVEQFYTSRGAPSQIDVCPLHGPEVFELLKNRGYVMAELNNVLWRPLRIDEAFPPPPKGIAIRPGRPDEADEFTAIVARSFYPEGDTPEGFHEMLAPIFKFEGGVKFVASVDGEIAAVAAGLLIPEHRVIALFGAGTLAPFRGRGIQQALFAERMKMAVRSGCDVAVVVTQGGTTSQRNAERLGFRVAYSKATLVRSLNPK